ncbi:MAG: M20/M25/M40 family metallo-hydrolase [Armatimonadetes bacterium]|nr:M20/M25/M40 family metallo-hydrolase [Armatimonadota bacterium]
MTRERLLQLLETLLPTHSPSGEEGEMDALLLPYFREWCAEVHHDVAGNLIGRIPGRTREGAIQIHAHKDEIGMIVKRIDADGKIHARPLGGALPWKYGEGPVELLGSEGPVPAVLCVGCTHTSHETAGVQSARTGPLVWENVYLDAKLSREALAARGIRVGSRAVVARSRRQPLFLGDYVGGWALDDKGAVAILLGVMEALAPLAGQLPVDVYFVATAEEEIGAANGAYVARRLPADTVIALEVGPVAEEYASTNSPQPIVWYQDAYHSYTKRLCDRFLALADDLGFGAQPVVLSTAGTDASAARKYGQGGAVACLSFPTENTHGYEVAHLAGMLNTAALLEAYLRAGE